MLAKLKKEKLNARKAGDKTKLTAIDFVMSKLDKKRVEVKVKTVDELSDEQVQKAIESEIKEQKQSLEFTKGTPVGDDNEAVIEYLTSILPEKLSEEDIKNILSKHNLLSVDKTSIGSSMKEAKKIFAGESVDMSLVSKLVRG